VYEKTTTYRDNVDRHLRVPARHERLPRMQISEHPDGAVAGLTKTLPSITRRPLVRLTFRSGSEQPVAASLGLIWHEPTACHI
jgi:hypothetical protein